jgi:hypothetical protein
VKNFTYKKQKAADNLHSAARLSVSQTLWLCVPALQKRGVSPMHNREYSDPLYRFALSINLFYINLMVISKVVPNTVGFFKPKIF